MVFVPQELVSLLFVYRTKCDRISSKILQTALPVNYEVTTFTADYSEYFGLSWKLVVSDASSDWKLRSY